MLDERPAPAAAGYAGLAPFAAAGFFLAGARKRKEVWALSERSACAALAVLVVAVVSSKIIYLLSEQGFYFGVFRQIYDWTVLYL